MQCIQLDFINNDTSPNAFTYNLRTAFLLADTTNCIGTSAFYISFKYYYNLLSIKQKADLMYKDPKCDDELRESIELYYSHLKTMRRWKHPPQDVFLAHKRIENAIETIVSSWADSINEVVKNVGLENVLHICEKDVFDIYDINRALSTTSKIYLHPKDVVNNQSPKNAIRNSIWLMPHVFHHSKFFDENILTSVDSLEHNKPYLIKLFEFSNINTLSATQLTSVKNQLRDSLFTFREDMKVWTNLCYNGGDGSEFVKEKILPHIPFLQNQLDNNLILQHNHSLHKVDKKNTIDIYIGEVSPISLWKYYSHFQIITNEEFEDLLQEYNSNPPYHLPVLLFCPFDTLEFITFDDTETEDEAINTIQPVKKSIDID